MQKRIIRNRSVVNVPDEFPEYIAALHRAVHALALYFEDALDGAVTQAEAVVLFYLAREGECTINDVHRAFLHKRSTLTSVVDRLERKGLVRRRIGASDRRNFALELTAQGRKSASRVLQALLALRLAVNATAHQIESAVTLLEKTAKAANA
jgi:DNA-binding MarR family transcriptional regulator